MAAPRLWRHLQVLALITVVGSAALGFAGVIAISTRWLYSQHTAQLQRRLELLQESFAPAVARHGPSGELDAACKAIGAREGIRLTVIRTDGVVLGDTDHDPAGMVRHAARSEVVAALQGGVGVSVRHSDTSGQRRLYVAVPLRDEAGIVGALRASLATSDLLTRIAPLWRWVALWQASMACLGGLLLAFGIGRAGDPLRDMIARAEPLLRGEYGMRVGPTPWRETGFLARVMNELADRLSERIAESSRQQSLETAILSSMIGCVLALDSSNTVISMNESASRLLRVPVAEAIGKRVEAVVRIDTVLEFLRRTSASDVPLVEDLCLHSGGQLYFRGHGTRLRDAGGASMGVLAVLHDVTRLHRLETVRREFVANVSHELKTPITAIKGFVETLLAELGEQGKGQNEGAPSGRFLPIIARQADRLNAIVDDLLSLARIEQGAELGRLVKVRGYLNAVIASALGSCRPAAESKRIAFGVDCPAELAADFDARLLEQALVNLLDNAVKYSDAGSTVEIVATRSGEDVEVSVRDHGCGIEEQHLPRLFERFYRVDKGRSRAEGGTGLGLSIVKHVALAHEGSVRVESEPGVGSVFCLRIPAGRGTA